MSEQDPPSDDPGATEGPRDPKADAKTAKAEAKAAKAYAKAQRPWYKKKRWWLAGVVLLIVVISVASSGGGSDNSSNNASNSGAANPAASGNNAAPSTAPASSGPTSKLPLQDGDWRLDTIRVQDDGLGDFGGNARITYTGDNPDGGSNIFTVTVFVGGKDVAVLNGSVNATSPGDTDTVQLISTDNFVGGPYTYDFQAEL